MSAIPGTNIASRIVPFDTADTFATHLDKYGRGGYRVVDSIAERDSITEQRQKVGMLVYVQSEDKIYKLTVVGTPPTYVELQFSGSTGVTTVNDISGAVNISSGDGILIDETGQTITISVSGNYITESEVANISGNLQNQITVLQNYDSLVAGVTADHEGRIIVLEGQPVPDIFRSEIENITASLDLQQAYDNGNTITHDSINDIELFGNDGSTGLSIDSAGDATFGGEVLIEDKLSIRNTQNDAVLIEPGYNDFLGGTFNGIMISPVTVLGFNTTYNFSGFKINTDLDIIFDCEFPRIAGTDIRILSALVQNGAASQHYGGYYKMQSEDSWQGADTESHQTFGVYAEAEYDGSNSNHIVYGLYGKGIITSSGTAWAGYFDGDVAITSLTPANSGNFLTWEADGKIVDSGYSGSDISELQTDVTDLSGAIDGKLDKTGGTITGDLTVQQNLYVNGTEFIVNTVSVSAQDNIIVLNSGEVGNGVTSGHSGIRVDRGQSDDYFFVYDENRDGFALGVATDESSGSLLSQTQMAATREDNPIDQYIVYWNDSAKRFDTANSTTIASITGASSSNTVIVGGDGIQSIEGPSDTWTLSVSGDYATNSTVASISADLQSQIDNIEISGAGNVYQGKEECNTTDQVYVINHAEITVDQVHPQVSLVVPTSGDTLYLNGITNRTSTSFEVILSSVPSISGYGINWLLVEGTSSGGSSGNTFDDINVNGDINSSDTSNFYFGDADTDGSWRIVRVGNNLEFQRRESGVWNTKSSMTP